MVAHFWSGGTPQPCEVRELSDSGLYVVTEFRWSPGTLILLALQRTDCEDGNPSRSIVVNTRVVHCGEDGIGLEFLPSQAVKANSPRDAFQLGADRTALQKFMKNWHADAGQALVEYILVLPFVFLLIVNIVNFAGFFYAWITVANAARAGADYAILGGSSVAGGKIATPTGSQVQSLITNDISSLPNRASLVVNVCQNSGSAVTTLAGTCGTVASDPESSYLISVDVTYTYQPFIPGTFRFPNLNIYATLPPTTVHRTTVMRSLR